MKRITVMIPDDLDALVQQERRRRDVSAATIVREAIEAYLMPSGRQKRLSFIGIGQSDHTDTARNVDAILNQEWGSAGRR
jgi:hypothetical protein